jgi:hypothetical protein
MKRWLFILMTLLLAAGCATNTVAKRKQKRPGAYEALTPEFKAAVDQGQIKVGMSTDAVYLAWGKPSQVLNSETPQGAIATWLYEAAQLQRIRLWSYYPYLPGDYTWGGPRMVTDFYPVNYIAAEVIFEKGLVRQWRTLAAPPD